MSSLANPNWLAVGAAMFTMCGAGLLTKALIQGSTSSLETLDRKRAAAIRSVNATFGAPLLGAGLFLNAVSQVATASLGALMTAALLALAFGMLLYACYEHMMIDAMIGEPETVKKAPRLALLPPASVTEVREVVVETKVAEAAG